ncbi:hypothetical protein VNI00_016491 [Paramarasmius palmivorus]|uniref:Ribonuclease H1 N-terminal domain-containing protein n=1 Tax=Paramarasmius palmivorus TaxID=297713 RepID=A0AAW0BDM2_9AGAR
MTNNDSSSQVATDPANAVGDNAVNAPLVQPNSSTALIVSRTCRDYVHSRVSRVYTGWTITTTVTFERKAPVDHDAGVVSAVSSAVSSAATPPASTNSPVVHPRAIPHPSTLVLRPGMDILTRFHVIFRGCEVGIFYSWKNEARHLVEGVPETCHRAYSTWNEAHSMYSLAYNGQFPGHKLRIIDPQRFEIALDSGSSASESHEHSGNTSDEDDSTYRDEDSEMGGDASSGSEDMSEEEMDVESEEEFRRGSSV